MRGDTQADALFDLAERKVSMTLRHAVAEFSVE